MRITFLLPGITIHGGIKSTFEIANRLVERGHHVRIIHPLVPTRNGASLFDARNHASRALGLITNIRDGKKLEWFDLRAELIRAPMIRARYVPAADIIVATWWENAYDVHRFAEDKGRKFYFMRAYETFGGPRDKVDASYELPLTRLAVSTWLKDFIENRFGAPVQGPFPDAIDSDVFRCDRETFLAHDPVRVGMLYRRIPLKGISDGLAAFEEVRQHFPQTRLVLFGDKPSASDQQQIEELGNVEFHLSPYGLDIAAIYGSLDVFVFPSHVEGFGNPPMEAMACGAACVATRVGGIPEYSINGQTALVVPPGDIRALTVALMRLLEDEGFRQRIARAGCEHIKCFTWDATVEKLECLFFESLEL